MKPNGYSHGKRIGWHVVELQGDLISLCHFGADNKLTMQLMITNNQFASLVGVSERLKEQLQELEKPHRDWSWGRLAARYRKEGGGPAIYDAIADKCGGCSMVAAIDLALTWKV